MSTISSEKSETKEVADTKGLSRDQNLALSSHGSLELEQLPAEGDGEEPVYATGLRLVMIIATINLSSLIASLDLGIVATAIPKITQDFHGLDNIGWYSAACFVTVGVTSAMWGKMYKYLPAQWTYMCALGIYLVGSIVAASAPNSIALIVGRAIQGWGCSGVLSGSVLIINYTAAPSKRPMLIGMWIGVFMCATILGPVLGGVFTTELTWRWCFWINLPVGGLAIALQLIFLRIPKHIKTPQASWKEILLNLDFPGAGILLASLVCLILALEWGGVTKPWSNGSVIATLVLWIVLTIACFVVEYVQGECAGIPFRLFKQRMIWSNALYAFITNAANFQVLFYLPYYFQSVKGKTAIISGVYTLPFLAFYAVGAMVSGYLLGKTRMMHPLMAVSGLLAVLGAALLYSMDVNTSQAWYIGAQIPFGLGIGLANQVPVTVVQAFTDPADVAIATAIVFTFQTSTGAYFTSAAQSIFENLLLQSLTKNAPDVDIATVLAAGASALDKKFSGVQLSQVIQAYTQGIQGVFSFSIAAAALTIFLTFLVPFKKIPAYADKMTREAVQSEKDSVVEV